MYFDNECDVVFDVKKVAKALGLNEKDVLNTFGVLLDKKLIKLSSAKNENGKLIDVVSLDNLYNGIKNNLNKKENADKMKDFFSKFQSSYGHSLSGMDYEIINAWITNGFSEELIIGAVEEAKYNGVTSLRYIDKILFEWQKKGFKSMNDVKNHLKQRNHSDSMDKYQKEILEYNWLDE